MKAVYKKKRHMDWNWERSVENQNMIRYHFVGVDDKNRKGTIDKILEQFQLINDGIITIREFEGKVINTNLRYFLGSYDSYTSPKMIDFKKISLPLRRDRKLYERKKGSIEDYVSNRYERI